MTDILFISETDIKAELQLAQSEMVHCGYSISQAVRFDKAIDLLRISSINVVLINAASKKLEAYDLVRDIKEVFRGAIKVFVYLPESNPNEGSKFGLLNAEVEDHLSIKTIVNKLNPKKQREYILEENISSVYSLNGGAGSSFITILLAYVLNYHNQESLVLESSNTFSIRDSLRIEPGLALLSRDRSKEINQARDLDWFNGFLANPALAPKMSYLNLFTNVAERMSYLDQGIDFAINLANNLEEIVTKSSIFNDETTHLYSAQEARSKILNIANSTKLLAKDMEGDSFSLFDEILQLGSKVSKNIFFDLSSDLSSSINKQLLRFSKNLIIVFKDVHKAKEEYWAHKKFLEDKYKLNVIPVLAPGYYHYSKYLNFVNSDWHKILGEVPLIYPYRPDVVARIIYEAEPIAESEKLFIFASDLLLRLGINPNREGYKSSRNILKLLAGSNA